MRIVVFAEGSTERACRAAFKSFLDDRTQRAGVPKVGLDIQPRNGAEVWNPEIMHRHAERELARGDVAGIVVLVDLVPEFASPGEVQQRYAKCTGPRIRAHCAKHDFEAWLLPYQNTIHRIARKPIPKTDRWPQPENRNHNRPPSRILREDVFTGNPGYRKTIHAPAILRGQDLTVAAGKCPQLKAFLNTLLEFAGVKERL